MLSWSNCRPRIDVLQRNSGSCGMAEGWPAGSSGPPWPVAQSHRGSRRPRVRWSLLAHLQHLEQMAMLVAEGLLGLGPLGKFPCNSSWARNQVGRSLLDLLLQLIAGSLRCFLGLLNGAKQGTDGGDTQQEQQPWRTGRSPRSSSPRDRDCWDRPTRRQDGRAANRHRQHRHGDQQSRPCSCP